MATTLTFFGTNTLLIRRGSSALLIDPHFTRPSLWQLTRKIEPDPRLIQDALSNMQITHLDGVLLTHTHYDHALDAVEVINQTGSVLYGSESACNLAYSAGLGVQQVEKVLIGQHLRIGEFEIKIHTSRHLPFPPPLRWLSADGQKINYPQKLPAYFWQYASGQVLAIQVDNILILGSAGFEPGACCGLEVDHVVLAVGGLGLRSIAYLETMYQEVVVVPGARQVVLSHWDDFFRPLERPLRMLGRSAKSIRRIQSLGNCYGQAVKPLKPGESIQILFKTD